jgi:hypothetical protein
VRFQRAVVVLGLAWLAACSSGSGPGADSGAESDSGADSGADSDSDSDSDSGADSDSDSGADSDSDSDSGADSAAGPDSVSGRRARVFAHDPATDDFVVVEVTLPPTTTDDGTLTSGAVDVRNCLPDPGGPSMGFGAHFCLEQKVARPGPDGSYLHIKPPNSHKDPRDSFAELMMYHHVNRVHGYFHDAQGVTWLDYPLQALVNVQFDLGSFGGWQPFPNAAYLRPNDFGAIGLPPREGGAIVFGQFLQTDFSYDASVIYHEYTHAVIGGDKLVGTALDDLGLDLLPGALNEGLADYFAASILDNPVIGAYGLAFAGPQFVRDLSAPRRCPDSLIGEVHMDGRIAGSGLWALREALGAPTADAMVMDAIAGAGYFTSFTGFSQLLLAAAALRGADVEAKTEAVLTDFGLLDCERVKAWVPYDASVSFERAPYALPGRDNGVGYSLPDGAPAYFQWRVDVPAGAQGVRLEYRAVTVPDASGAGGDAPLDVELAVRRGQPVAVNALGGGQLTADARAAGLPGADPRDRSVTLAGGCLGEEATSLYVLFVSQAGPTGALERMDITVIDDLPPSAEVVTCQ